MECSKYCEEGGFREEIFWFLIRTTWREMLCRSDGYRYMGMKHDESAPMIKGRGKELKGTEERWHRAK